MIGGGLPIGAYGGRADIMSQVAPGGPIYQAGTLSGNPLAVGRGSGGLACSLKAHPEIYEQVERMTAHLTAEPPPGTVVNRVGSMYTFFFTDQPVTYYESAKRSDTKRFARFHRAMLEQGVYLAPSQFESGFVSAAHTGADIANTVAAARKASAA